MNRISLLIASLVLASQASATGITGTVTRSGGGAVWPCTINILNRNTGQPVVLSNDTTLTNGTYSLTLPNAKYDLTFLPKAGSHAFPGSVNGQTVNNNTLVVNLTLPIGQYVSGKVVTTTGTGVGTTDIRFRDTAGNVPRNVANNGTNADGTFTTLVDPGLWIVEIVPANAVHKAPVAIPNQNLVGQDINEGNVVVQNGHVITCSVTDQSLFPVVNASIVARTIPGRVKMFNPINNTAASGVATIVLPDGTYDIIATPPPGTTFATQAQYSISPVAADITLPNFALPPGHPLTAHVVDPLANPVFNVNVDVDRELDPTFPRIYTANNNTDALGNLNVTVPQMMVRLTVQPPVATRLLSIHKDSVVVTATGVNVGTIVCPQGHWVDVTVLEQGTNLPIVGGNINLFNLSTGKRLVTIDNTTVAGGTARIVTDNLAYRVKVYPPTAANDTAYVIGPFRSLTDTVLTVFMPRKGVLGVGGSSTTGLHLAAPWPNPSRTGATFVIAGRGAGELEILDVSGRRVAAVWQGEFSGEQTVRWEGNDALGRAVPNGMYFARLRSGSERSVRRIVIAH